MMRRNFITGKWEEAPDDLSGTYVHRDGQVVRAGEGGYVALKESTSRGTICSKNPWVSRTMGFHETQINEVREDAKKAGARFEINDHGHVVATSKGARNDAIKFFGWVDRDGGYSDHTG